MVMDWHKFARKGILGSKIVLLLMLGLIVALLTSDFIPNPYNALAIGIEICLILMSVFMIVRMGTYKPFREYDGTRLNITDKELLHLLRNIDYDVQRYNEGSYYYLNGVRIYKYSTVILAGVSTIILGLDLDVTVPIFDTPYAKFSKNTALIIGAVITIYTSLMTYWNIEKYWLINKTIANKLRMLRDSIENYHQSTDKLDREVIKNFVKDYAESKETFSKYWEGALSERSSKE